MTMPAWYLAVVITPSAYGTKLIKSGANLDENHRISTIFAVRAVCDAPRRR
jgi:hypothetical protein